MRIENKKLKAKFYSKIVLKCKAPESLLICVLLHPLLQSFLYPFHIICYFPF